MAAWYFVARAMEGGPDGIFEFTSQLWVGAFGMVESRWVPEPLNFRVLVPDLWKENVSSFRAVVSRFLAGMI